MERVVKTSSFRGKPKKFMNSNKPQIIQKAENIPEGPCNAINSPALMSQLYLNIDKAVNSLLSDITSECARRISSIKKSTLQASIQISKLKVSLNEMLRNKSFSENCIRKLKDFSTEASFFYKPQCENFNLFIDKVAEETRIAQNLNQIRNQPVESHGNGLWGIVKGDGGINFLPEWINKQIDVGVGYGATEINIYKKSEIVSIADVKKMMYFGLLNGKKLQGQELRRVR